ncbi:hypothetical protein FPE01S_01_04280 [Flavihumibacter petaseus NBRC 106054]|uniref:Uncharacterized protein n=1 Tax=Flavihumibacter petaseus NBRC 106054 TaxID=1220578 RepID=A0A0E9MVH8_9BACT|nr:hypothetical protein FPE01S_01_04280 [Flavihumibacter petaseus NBRC 106054]
MTFPIDSLHDLFNSTWKLLEAAGNEWKCLEAGKRLEWLEAAGPAYYTYGYEMQCGGSFHSVS